MSTTPTPMFPEAVQFAAETLTGVIADLDMLYSFFTMAQDSCDGDLILDSCQSLASMVARMRISTDAIRKMSNAGFTDEVMQKTMNEAPSLY